MIYYSSSNNNNNTRVECTIVIQLFTLTGILECATEIICCLNFTVIAFLFKINVDCC